MRLKGEIDDEKRKSEKLAKELNETATELKQKEMELVLANDYLSEFRSNIAALNKAKVFTCCRIKASLDIGIKQYETNIRHVYIAPLKNDMRYLNELNKLKVLTIIHRYFIYFG